MSLRPAWVTSLCQKEERVRDVPQSTECLCSMHKALVQYGINEILVVQTSNPRILRATAGGIKLSSATY